MTLFLFSFNEIGNRVNKLAVIDCCQMINDQFACDIDFILEEKAPDKKVYLKLSAAKENLEDQTWSPIPGALLSQVGWKQLGGFPCICETKAGHWSRRAGDLWRTGVNTVN